MNRPLRTLQGSAIMEGVSKNGNDWAAMKRNCGQPATPVERQKAWREVSRAAIRRRRHAGQRSFHCLRAFTQEERVKAAGILSGDVTATFSRAGVFSG